MSTLLVRFAITLNLLLVASTLAFAQETVPAPENKLPYRPDIPGSFVIELGVNLSLNKPDSLFKMGIWGSRTFNIYYQYNLRILKSKFSFHPGLGFSLERYKFKNGYTLANGTGANAGNTELVPGPVGVKKSMGITNFVEVPLELRFSTNPNDPARSFRASLGVRAGYLIDSFTKVRYKENKEMKTYKNKQDYNFSPFRYGAFIKVGAGTFSLFGYYNLVPLFKSDKGPLKTDMNTYTVGISLSGF